MGSRGTTSKESNVTTVSKAVESSTKVSERVESVESKIDVQKQILTRKVYADDPLYLTQEETSKLILSDKKTKKYTDLLNKAAHSSENKGQAFRNIEAVEKKIPVGTKFTVLADIDANNGRMQHTFEKVSANTWMTTWGTASGKIYFNEKVEYPRLELWNSFNQPRRTVNHTLKY